MLGIPAIEVDGMELLAVRRAMQEARRIIAAQGGPVMIEALCYRFLHQAGPRPGSEFGYRSRKEEKEWQARDPLATFPDQLLREGLIAGEGPARLDAKASALVAAAATRLTEEVAGSNQLRVPPGFFPDHVTVDSGIRGDLGELAGERFRELTDYAPADLAPTK